MVERETRLSPLYCFFTGSVYSVHSAATLDIQDMALGFFVLLNINTADGLHLNLRISVRCLNRVSAPQTRDLRGFISKSALIENRTERVTAHKEFLTDEQN